MVGNQNARDTPPIAGSARESHAQSTEHPQFSIFHGINTSSVILHIILTVQATARSASFVNCSRSPPTQRSPGFDRNPFRTTGRMNDVRVLSFHHSNDHVRLLSDSPSLHPQDRPVEHESHYLGWEAPVWQGDDRMILSHQEGVQVAGRMFVRVATFYSRLCFQR
jgi:hypothetical protein